MTLHIHPHAAECPRRQDALDGRAEQARHLFTPEPWESVESGRYVRAKGRCVAKLDWDIRDATDDANARLIAAAPDLYEVVAESLYHLRLDDRAQSYHERALAALAKARGGE